MLTRACTSPAQVVAAGACLGLRPSPPARCSTEQHDAPAYLHSGLQVRAQSACSRRTACLWQVPAPDRVWCQQGTLPDRRRPAGHAVAVKTQTTRVHDHAVQAPCPHFGPCGGCALQDLAYDRQLAYKAGRAAEALVRFGKQQAGGARALPPLPAPHQLKYRNTVRHATARAAGTWGQGCEGQPAPAPAWGPAPSTTGGDSANGQGGTDARGSSASHAAGSRRGAAQMRFRTVKQPTPRFGLLSRAGDRVVPITKCLLQDDRANVILKKVSPVCSSRAAASELQHKLAERPEPIPGQACLHAGRVQGRLGWLQTGSAQTADLCPTQGAIGVAIRSHACLGTPPCWRRTLPDEVCAGRAAGGCCAHGGPDDPPGQGGTSRRTRLHVHLPRRPGRGPGAPGQRALGCMHGSSGW